MDEDSDTYSCFDVLIDQPDGMTVGRDNDIPLLNKFSKKRLRRQKAQDENVVQFDDATKTSQRKHTRSSSYVRSDSVRERYARVGDVGTIRKYTVALLQAVENGNYAECEELLENSTTNIDEKDEETGYTALHVAAKNDSYDILRLLLDKGTNCNAQDKTEQTALHISARKDHQVCSQILLDRDALKINAINKTHDTPLHVAAKEGRIDICQMILNRNGVKVNCKNKKGTTPLHFAAQENHIKILELLIQHGGEWKIQDNHSFIPIHYAAQKGFDSCCGVLVSNLSEIDKQKQLEKCTKDGKTPLMLAAKGGHHRCCEIMEYRNIDAKDKEGNTALHYAAAGGYDYTVKELLEAQANPNTLNKKGSAPILEAVGKKKFGCLKILAEKNATLNVSDKQKKTVLHYAAEKNAIDSLKFLLTYPVLISHIDKQDKNSCSALHLAIKKEADDCALLLLENGASPTDTCSGGMTPLHLAADRGSTSICEYLLAQKDVHVSKENEQKATPLHMAALRGSIDVCQMLIRKAARITAADVNGRTALHVASSEGHATVVKFLAKKGIPLKLRDDKGCCALHLAASKGSLECCQVLVSAAKATCWEADQQGDLSLDRAFKEEGDDLEEYDQVFKYLLYHLCFKKNDDRQLRIHKYLHIALKEKRLTIIEAIVDSCWWEFGFSGENGHPCPNFRELISEYPALALKLQDKCIKRSKDSHSEVTYDFALFEDNYYIPSPNDKLAKSPFDPETRRVAKNAIAYTEDGLKWKREHPLTLMISHTRHKLLHHPLVKTWLWQKWNSYMYIIFWILLFIDILFASFLAGFMGITDNWTHVKKNCKLEEDTFCKIAQDASKCVDSEAAVPDFNDTSSLCYGYLAIYISDFQKCNENVPHSTENSSLGYGASDICNFQKCNENVLVKQILWIGLLILTFVTILLELNYLWRLKKEYVSLRDSHLVQVLRIIFTLMILLPWGTCEFHHMILNVPNWQCGIIALLLTWMRLINTLNQLPMLSVFMPVTLSFAKSFFKVVFYIIMIVFIFAFIFHLLLKNHSAFEHVPQAMVKTIVWMLGDLAYDDTFLSDNDELYYPIMANCLFVVFVTILGGFIANLVIAQPSDKLDTFREEASFHKAASRTELFLKLDICFPFFRKQRTVGSYVDDESKAIDYNFLSKKLLMLDIKEEIQQTETIDPIQNQLEELSKQFNMVMIQQAEQREEVRDLKHQINFLTKSLLENKQF